MPLYTFLLLIVIIISLIGFWLNNAETSYLSSKVNKMIKRPKKKSKKNRQFHHR